MGKEIARTFFLCMSLVFGACSSGAQQIPSDLCLAINFALANGSRVSNSDFYHCHVLTRLDGPKTLSSEQIENGYVGGEVTEVSSMEKGYFGLLCHAHEVDDKRNPKLDNFNIVAIHGQRPRFFGVSRIAHPRDIGAKFLAGHSKAVHSANQIDFYDKGPDCEKFFPSYKTLSCAGRSYCYASAKIGKQYTELKDLKSQPNPFSTKQKLVK